MISVGDYVFAKMRGFPPWPAVVERIVGDKPGKFSNYSFEVYFYGTHQIGCVRETDIFPYEDNLERFQAASKRIKFCLALKEIEEERSACYKSSRISNDSVIQIKDCSVRLERIDLMKIPHVNIPRDCTANINAFGSSEPQNCSDIECEYINSPKRFIINKKFEDCVLIEEESPNLENSSINRTKPIKQPALSVVRRLFRVKEVQQEEEDIMHTANGLVSGSRQLNTAINCRNSPIIFIESDEADSGEDESTHVQTSSRIPSQRSILEENKTEVELLTEVDGAKRGHRRPSSGFYDLPTPPSANSISEPKDNPNAMKSLPDSFETTDFCDVSTPKLSMDKTEFPNIRTLRAKLKENGQNLEEWAFVHDLSTLKGQSTAKFDDSSCDELGQTSGSKESLLLVSCDKNCFSLPNSLISSRREENSIMDNFGKSIVRTSQGSDEISKCNSEPIEIDLVSDSSDEETNLPCGKYIEPKRREIDFVVHLSNTLPDDRKALFAYSRAMWKSRHKELYASNESTESNETLHEPDDYRVSEVLRGPVPSKTTLSSYRNTSEESHPVTLSISEELHKSHERSSALLESIGICDPSVPLVENCSSDQPFIPSCEDRLHTECQNNDMSPKYSAKELNSNLSVESGKDSSASHLSGNRAVPTSEDLECTSTHTNNVSSDCHSHFDLLSSDGPADINLKKRNTENVHLLIPGKNIIIKLQRLDNKIIQSYLRPLCSPQKLASGNFSDGSKKRKMYPPKKRFSPDKYSSYCSSHDGVNSNEVSRSAVEDNAVKSADGVGVPNVDIRPVVSDAKTNHKFLRRKMFSLVRKDRPEDTSSLSATGLLKNHEIDAPGETQNVSQQSKVPGMKINGARQFDHIITRIEEMDHSQLSSVGEEPSNPIVLGEKRKCEKSRVVVNGVGGKRGLKRCEVCWLMVENVTDHILNDHRDMFT